jgi:hypothetical protein
MIVCQLCIMQTGDATDEIEEAGRFEELQDSRTMSRRNITRRCRRLTRLTSKQSGECLRGILTCASANIAARQECLG